MSTETNGVMEQMERCSDGIQNPILQHSTTPFRLRAAIELGQNKLVVAQRFGCCHTAIARALEHFERGICCLIEIHFQTQNPGDIYVNVLGHGRESEWIAGQFDDGNYRIADDVALAGGEKMD